MFLIEGYQKHYARPSGASSFRLISGKVLDCCQILGQTPLSRLSVITHFPAMLLHTTNSECRSSRSANTGGYKLIVVQIPGVFGLKPVWPVNASPLGGGWVGKTMAKYAWGQNCWKHLILKAAEACLDPQLLGTVAVLPPCTCKALWAWEMPRSLVSVYLPAACNQNTEIQADIYQVSMIWLLVEMQWQSAFSSETEGWGWLPSLPCTAPGNRTPWTPWKCRMLSGGSNIHPLSARFITVQIAWKIHEVVKCEWYKANPSVWSIWQGKCRSDYNVNCKSFFF